MKEKKSYVRPQISKVELTPEEAVLAHCKTASGTARSAAYKCRSKCTSSTAGS